MQIGNISHRLGRSLTTNPENGRITNDTEAMNKFWGREYESGWEIKI
jgi:hypothetical protein